MTRSLLIASALVLAVRLAAQPAEEPKYSGHGYGYYAVGGSPGIGAVINGLGVGGEALIYKGLAAGAEIGYQFPARGFKEGLGLLSLNPAWHFAPNGRKNKIVPFVTGGYSLAFRQESLSLLNYGAGVTWWFRDRLGLRVEVRDQRRPGRDAFNFVQFRAALSFR